MTLISAETKARYQENRTRKYRECPEWRAHILEKNRISRSARREEINAKRRARWASDPEYREKQLSPRRGRSQRADQLKVKYGITIDRYNEIFAAQGGKCAICHSISSESLCVDHCHSTGKIRSLLCRKCNTGLGCYEDNPVLLGAAISYLAKHHVH